LDLLTYRGHWLPVLILALCANNSLAETPETLPSEELLMFLAEFDDVDDETFALLMERAKRDKAEQGGDETDREKEKSRGANDEEI